MAQDSDSTFTLMIENSITLQKVMTEVAISLKSLNEKLENLLELFNDSAKNFNDKKQNEIKGNEELKQRIDEINQQNKIIAKGVMLLEQTVRTDKESEEIQPFKPRPLPEFKP